MILHTRSHCKAEILEASSLLFADCCFSHLFHLTEVSSIGGWSFVFFLSLLQHKIVSACNVEYALLLLTHVGTKCIYFQRIVLILGMFYA